MNPFRRKPLLRGKISSSGPEVEGLVQSVSVFPKPYGDPALIQKEQRPDQSALQMQPVRQAVPDHSAVKYSRSQSSASTDSGSTRSSSDSRQKTRVMTPARGVPGYVWDHNKGYYRPARR